MSASSSPRLGAARRARPPRTDGVLPAARGRDAGRPIGLLGRGHGRGRNEKTRSGLSCAPASWRRHRSRPASLRAPTTVCGAYRRRVRAVHAPSDICAPGSGLFAPRRWCRASGCGQRSGGRCRPRRDPARSRRGRPRWRCHAGGARVGGRRTGRARGRGLESHSAWAAAHRERRASTRRSAPTARDRGRPLGIKLAVCRPGPGRGALVLDGARHGRCIDGYRCRLNGRRRRLGFPGSCAQDRSLGYGDWFLDDRTGLRRGRRLRRCGRGRSGLCLHGRRPGRTLGSTDERGRKILLGRADGRCPNGEGKAHKPSSQNRPQEEPSRAGLYPRL